MSPGGALWFHNRMMEDYNERKGTKQMVEHAKTHNYDPTQKEVWVWKKMSFDAAHQLPLYDGACKRVHGHTYFVELGILCTINPTTGMGIDLKEVGQFLDINVHALLDHQMVNERLPSDLQSTAEQIGLYILRVALRYFRTAIKVKVFETPDSWIELEDEEIEPENL